MPYDFRQGRGCALLLTGGLMAFAGLLTLSGLVPVELEFFRIDIDSRPKKIVWTVGFAATALGGYLLLRRRPTND